ncbi:MAG: hypothetical protein ACR2II_10660 [Chthoniobacterales bacterium]
MHPHAVIGFEVEIGNVLFMDIVGHSKLVTDQQAELTRKRNEIARNTPQFRLPEAEGTLVRLSNGDGIALIFRNHPEAPAQWPGKAWI